MIMFFNGELIRIYNEDLKDDISDEFDDQVKPPWWFILEFTGALIAALSWVCVSQLTHYTLTSKLSLTGTRRYKH